MDDAARPGRQAAGAAYGDLKLLARLLVGLTYLGTDELLTRLRAIGRDVAADVEVYDLTVPDGESMAEMVIARRERRLRPTKQSPTRQKEIASRQRRALAMTKEGISRDNATAVVRTEPVHSYRDRFVQPADVYDLN